MSEQRSIGKLPVTIDTFVDPIKTYLRLFNEYEKHGNIVIGLDFDNTLFDCHNRGQSHRMVIDLIKDCNDLGLTVCLWTANDCKELVTSECSGLGIKFDYYNESPLLPNSKSPKPYFNILLDDRAGLAEAYITLRELVDNIIINKGK